MDNLKQTLFEHTYHRLKQYQHDETVLRALYSVIEAAGLEDEYLAWREEMQEA